MDQKSEKIYEQLPRYFQFKVDSIDENHSFLRKNEMTVLYAEAVRIAMACRTPQNVQHFFNDSLSEQVRKVPGLTTLSDPEKFQTACNEAYQYLAFQQCQRMGRDR